MSESKDAFGVGLGEFVAVKVRDKSAFGNFGAKSSAHAFKSCDTFPRHLDKATKHEQVQCSEARKVAWEPAWA